MVWCGMAPFYRCRGASGWRIEGGVDGDGVDRKGGWYREVEEGWGLYGRLHPPLIQLPILFTG